MDFSARGAHQKLVLAGALLVGVLALGVASRSDAVSGARVGVGLVAVAGVLWWLLRWRGPSRSGGEEVPRLSVVQRRGLSQRASIALVEADGERLLIVFGDGVAQVERLGERGGAAPPRAPLALQENPTHRFPGGFRCEP